jgi:SOS-response transcriptional repressor LexA
MYNTANMYALAYAHKPNLWVMPSRKKSSQPLDPSEWFRKMRGNMSYREVAKRSGGLVSHTHLADLEKGMRPWSGASLETLEGVARGLGVPMETVLNVVRGKVFPSDEESHEVRDAAIPTDWEYMPFWGSGAAGYADDADAYIPVPPEHNKPGRVAMIVDGLSMYPTLQDGEMVYVDTTQTTPRHNKVFALRIAGNGIQFRRCIDVGTHFLFVPDNREKKYPIIGPDVEFEILGQVTEKPTLPPVD